MASIRERNGKFCVIYNYYDGDGRRRQKWETFKTKTEAKKRKKEIEYRMDQGILVVPQCTYLKELLNEYVRLYGKDKWALSTYDRNTSVIRNYILPVIGNVRLSEVNTRFLEKYYLHLLEMPSVKTPYTGGPSDKMVGTSVVRDVHKLLRNCLEQAVKWELIEKNPAVYATVPKHKENSRKIWTADTLMNALDVCEDEDLKLAINLSFAASLRIGELLALTWDCVDMSEEAIENGTAFLLVNKELQRVSRQAVESLDGKDILVVFPVESPLCKTVRVLKTPKTDSSVRKVFIPKSVARMLQEHKAAQEETKRLIGSVYQDYNLVMASGFGMPEDGTSLRKKLKKLIKEHDLPEVVFHSLRHTSVTYKLKLNGGDIKSVQGDSGHSQVSMVTNVYSHIIDEDRKRNAQLFEEAFYERKNLNPSMHSKDTDRTLTVPEGVDTEVLAKVLGNPEMMALLTSLAKTMGKDYGVKEND